MVNDCDIFLDEMLAMDKPRDKHPRRIYVNHSKSGFEKDEEGQEAELEAATAAINRGGPSS